MTRFLIALYVLLAAATATAAVAWAGRPSSPPPKPAQASGPPPAWIESASRSGWLDFGSYCWRTGCADYLPPATRPGLRNLKAPLGSTLRIHLAFKPKTLAARVLPARRFSTLKPGESVIWPVRKLGVLEVEAHGAEGSATYVIALRG